VADVSRTRSWTLGTVALSLVILLAGWFLLVSPKRSEANALQAQAAGVQQQNASLVTQIATLKAQNAKLPEQQAKLAKIRQQLPDNPALPGLIRSLSDVAKASGVQLVSLAPANPVAAKQPAPTAATSPAPGATTSGQTGVTAATEGTTGNLQVINVTIAVTGGYYDLEQFFNKVEGMTRSMLVTGFSMAPGTHSSSTASGSSSASTGDLSATIQARVFFSPATPTS
jgi:type IV pilus assembly protein PilO